ncbi:hypothetical protein KPB05_36535 [Burkholderia gladioli]|uniref:hypothetical protein n=1 Tax=Burkholderia gladioli TaxID=28095 RepID=UPI00286726F1|nr:hypothetical protein [Burkholderia gladioli]MDR8092968.1 hypothetical protein [Burkholderia gladioli]
MKLKWLYASTIASCLASGVPSLAVAVPQGGANGVIAAAQAGKESPAPKISVAPSSAPIAPAASTSPVQPQPGVQSSSAPTLGDWDDLSQREAFQARMKKLNEGSGQSAVAAPLPGGPLPPALSPTGAPQGLNAAGAAATEPKKSRASESCPDDNSPCFYALYGMSVDGGANNYRGLLAIDGVIVVAYKGKKFNTRKNAYVVQSISAQELVARDAKGRVRHWPFYGDADVAADAGQLRTQQATPMQPFSPFPAPPVMR